MYNFIDINSYDSSKPLPSEAVFFNGESLDQKVSGFKTLYVEGRESLENEFQELSLNALDGSSITSQRVLSRNLVIGFELSGDSPTQFETNYRDLVKKIMTREDAKWSFNDELSVYYLGRLKTIPAPEAHTIRQIMTMEIYCADPYKYSVTEKEITPLSDSASGTLGFQIENNGIIPVPIRIEAQFTDRNGYLTAYSSGMDFDTLSATSAGGTIELGDKTELNKVKVAKDQMTLDWADFLADTTIKTTSPGPTLAPEGLTWFYPHAMNTVEEYGDTWLYNSDEGDHQGGWVCGALKRLPIKTDAEGKTATKDFTVYVKHWFETSAMGECGDQDISIYTADDKLIARTRIYKDDASGNAAHCVFQWEYGTFRSFEFQASWDSPVGSNIWSGGEPCGHDRITKKDDWIEFFFAAKYYRFHDSRLTEMKAAKVQIAIANYVGQRPVAVNRMTNLSFYSLGVLTDQDVETVFKPGSSVLIDSSEGKSYVNGQYRPDLEILGSNYLKAYPGMNMAFIEPSRYVEDGSYSAKMYIREAWL